MQHGPRKSPPQVGRQAGRGVGQPQSPPSNGQCMNTYRTAPSTAARGPPAERSRGGVAWQMCHL
eukprot:3234438-Prymnesium_polylepis.1